MIVRDALVADPRVLEAHASVREAAELLARPNVRSVLVVAEGRLVGCVTPASIVAAVARGGDVATLTARDVSDEDVTTIAPDAQLDEAIHLMAENDLDRLAVVEEGRLVGVLPREGLVRRLAEDEAPPEPVAGES